jgi:hypothetical protein
MSLPDNLTGALTLSVIDFVLSFLFISGIGLVIALMSKLDNFKNLSPRKR